MTQIRLGMVESLVWGHSDGGVIKSIGEVYSMIECIAPVSGVKA